MNKKPLRPLSLKSGEWILFWFSKAKIIREIERGIARTTEQVMPVNIRMARVRRLDTGEIVENPTLYLHGAYPKLYWSEGFVSHYAETRCDFPDKEVD